MPCGRLWVRFLFSAVSSFSPALSSTSAENFPSASVVSPATSSIAANTPPFIFLSSPVSSSAPPSLCYSGSWAISASNPVFSSTSFTRFASFAAVPDVELRPNRRLDPFFPRQSQTQQFPFALQVNVKIKERAALAFRHHPLRQFRHRDVTWAELKFIPLLRLHDFLLRRHQFFAQLFVPCPLRRRQRLDIAVKLALHRCHLPRSEEHTSELQSHLN